MENKEITDTERLNFFEKSVRKYGAQISYDEDEDKVNFFQFTQQEDRDFDVFGGTVREAIDAAIRRSMETNIFVWCSHCSGNCHYIVAYNYENGEIASHISSDHEFGKTDMGIGSEKKHDTYKKLYPKGYKLIWVEKANEQ